MGDLERASEGERSLLVRTAPFALALLPLMWLIACVIRYHINVPFRDQWFFLYYIERWDDGLLTIRDFWIQESEHRHVFPYLLMLALAVPSRWNLSWELAANLVISCISFSALSVGFTRILKQMGISCSASAWFVPLLALVFFTTTPFDNWLCGWTMITFMAIMGMVVGSVLLSCEHHRWWHLVAAIVAAVVASYSFASGMMFWATGGIIILMGTRARQRVLWSIAWFVSGCLTVGAHLLTYKAPWWTRAGSVRNPAPVSVNYMMTYLGATLNPFSDRIAAICGFVGLLGLAGLALYLWRVRKLRVELIALPLGIALYAVGCAVAIAFGRAKFGQPLSPRYVTTSLLLWASVMFLLFAISLQGCATRSETVIRWAARAILAGIVLVLVYRSYDGRRGFRWYRDRLLPAQEELASMKDDALLKRLYPDPAFVREMSGHMRKRGLGIYRPQ